MSETAAHEKGHPRRVPSDSPGPCRPGDQPFARLTEGENPTHGNNFVDFFGARGEKILIKPAAPLLASVIRRVFFYLDTTLAKRGGIP